MRTVCLLCHGPTTPTRPSTSRRAPLPLSATLPPAHLEGSGTVKLPPASLYHMVLSLERSTNSSAPRWWSACRGALHS